MIRLMHVLARTNQLQFCIHIIIISFMQGIYTYIPETIYVPREYSVAAILFFLFMVHTSLAPVCLCQLLDDVLYTLLASF
jgi:hypothetical protein